MPASPTRLHVAIRDDDPLGSFVFSTTGFNSIRKERSPVSLDLPGFSGRVANVDKNEVRSACNRADYIERRRPMMAPVELLRKTIRNGRCTAIPYLTPLIY
jgi:hypothetical protein